MATIKAIKLSPKKGGHGHVTSFTVNIGCAEAREAGFLDDDGIPYHLEKVIDPDNQCIIIRKVVEG